MIGVEASSLPAHWLAWTGSGTTSTRLITVKYTQHYPAWSDAGSQTTLSEWAISSPALVYNGDGDAPTAARLGRTDTYHHLNVAAITV